MKKTIRIGREIGARFYPGIAIGILTDNHNGAEAHVWTKKGDEDNEIAMYYVYHKLLLPFFELAIIETHLEYTNEDEMMSLLAEIEEIENDNGQ